MSFFRPHKSKPRQFNYIPRHYDPLKEERDQRRKELHGTSLMDEEEYVPGKYIRTQRDAREVSHADNDRNGFKRMRNLIIIAVILGLFGLMIVPRFVKFANMANEEKAAKMEVEAERQRKIKFSEEIEHVEGIENKQLMEDITDKEAWQRSVGKIIIVPNDYDFSQDK